jgi:hypothetical protein
MEKVQKHNSFNTVCVDCEFGRILYVKLQDAGISSLLLYIRFLGSIIKWYHEAESFLRSWESLGQEILRLP